MPISITITADSPADLRAWLTALSPADVSIEASTPDLRTAALALANEAHINMAGGRQDLIDDVVRAAKPEPAPAEKPKRQSRAPKTEPTIPATAEAYEAALGEPGATATSATGDAGAKSGGSTDGTATSGGITSTSSTAPISASPSEPDLAVTRTRVQGKLRELAVTPGSGGRAAVAEVLNKINGDNVGAMTCPAENLPALEAEIDARLAALKAAA